MRISAMVRNGPAYHDAFVTTAGRTQRLAVSARPDGPGSVVNGGELLMLALATCFGNDLYREAAAVGIPVDGVEVEASADFAGVGLAATHVTYRARVDSAAPERDIDSLLRRTDGVAEVHNTLRAGVAVALRPW
jgi:organic hydroperoxide reductase OsmC/OhrA